MVSLVWALISLCSGMLVFVATPALAQSLPVDLRTGVGRFYFGMAQKSFRQTAIVWRELGGPELLPIGVDDEQKVAEVTLDSGVISDDKTHPFKDPDNRIHRLQQKPLAVVPEPLPAAVDAELSELGKWIRRHAITRGFEQENAAGDTKIDPFVRVPNALSTVNPLASMYAAAKRVEPEYVTTCEELTKERYSKYGTRIGAAETLGTLMGFGAGIGGMAMLAYLKQNTLSGGGGDGTTIPVNPTGMVLPADGLAHAVDIMGVLV